VTTAPTFKTNLPFPDGQTCRAKGRNLVNADALVLETWPDGVRLAARVQSTQGDQHAWLSMPADPEYLRWLSDNLAWAADLFDEKENS
jgi:hypothetical protein